MFGVALIAILAITGGIIAYIGDKLGTKVGKKKLTIFGLRPKHTSIVVTIITGILITVSTIGILSLVSRDVRTALFGMEALKNELTSLSQEVLTNKIELETSRSALEAKTAEYAVLSTKVEETTLQLQETLEGYAVARGDLSTAREAISSLQHTKDELDTRVQTLTVAKTGLQTDVDNLNELTTKLRQGIQVIREGSIIYRAGEILTTTVIPGGESKNNTAQAVSEVIYKTNESIIDRLNIEDKKLEVLWVAQADFDKVVAEIIATQQDVIVRITAGGNTVYGEPVVGHISIFPNHYIYKQDQAIHMAIVDVGQKNSSTEEIVMEFLQQVNAAAIKEGILPDPLQGTVGVISGNEFYDVVNTVKRYNGKVTLTATAKNDTYTSGPLKIQIHVQGVP